MKDLTSLTPKQVDRLSDIADEWISIGLRTGKSNEKKAEEAVREAYCLAGLSEPKIFIWLDSPYQGAIAASMLAQVGDQVRAQVRAKVKAQVGAQVWAQVGDQVRVQVGAQVWDQVMAQVRVQVRDQVMAQVRVQVRVQVWDQVGAQVGAQVGDQVRDQVWDQVGAQVWDQVGVQVRDQVGVQVRDQVGNQVGDQVRDQVMAQVRVQVGAQVGDQVNRACHGSHDAHWIAFYRAFEEFGIKEASKLSGIQKACKELGWWWPFEGAVIMTHRPISIHKDERNRIHNDYGPSLEYADGFCVYAIHGIRVEKSLVEDFESLSAKEIFYQRNTEVRRVLIDRYGAARYLKDMKGKLISSDDFGKLWKLDQKDDDPIMIVEVVNSSRDPDGSYKDYFLRVDPQLRPLHQETDSRGRFGEPQELTPLNAIASTFGMRGEEYSKVAVMT